MKKVIIILTILSFSIALTGCNFLKSEKAQVIQVQHKKQIVKRIHKPKKQVRAKKADLADEIFKETDEVLPK
ncbi:MAG: hypothetical protein PHC34_02535 [Candidatus Gastranaerophilales bacterium]|nr:hypothetical protein [Candidatus Gastranaerophilales bacterium]